MVGSCYCLDCQKETGSGHMSFVAVPDARFTISGTPATYTRLGDSGLPVERSFCPQCGSTVFARPQALAGMTVIRTGTLDSSSGLKPTIAVYTSRAADWDPVPEGLTTFVEMPPSG